MATGGLYGNASESVGLYGNTTNFGGSYFEWFIFIQSETQPATPTGGSWSFTTNSGTPPTGWSTVPPSAPTLPIWVSIALVNSRNQSPLVWSAPGLFSYSSGLPILSGSGAPSAGDGITDQLYIQTGTTPETIWFKQAGTWTRLTGSTLYVDLTTSQTIAGSKTFSSQIQGSVSGTSANVTGVVAIINGGTESTTAAGARTNLGVTATGQDTTYAYRANNLSDLASASTARTNLGLGSAAVLNAGVANGVATLDSGGTVPLSQIPASIQGGVSYQGAWNASTNTPTLTSSVGTKGYYYVVSTAGSTNLNGVTDWQIGDWAIFNGTIWQKIDNTDAVTSVNGYTGTVVLNAGDVGALSNITSTDGTVTITSPTATTRDLSVALAASATTLISQVRNETGATLTKGTVVYISGASGNKALVSKAQANTDATSAQTFGVVQADILNNQNGFVVVIGNLSGLDTSAFPDGTQLYLSGTVAGTFTSTKPYAPIHLVYVAIVTRSHVNQGSIEVKIQNGYEMDELHNVSAQSPSNGNTLVYNTSTSLWEASSTLSGSYTLSGGTANGVTYLNGSKVLTSGSALVFDGTNFSTTGTSKSNANLFNYNTNYWNVDGHLSNYSATNGVYLNGNIAGWLTLNADGTQSNKIQLYGASSGTANIMAFTTASSERMRIEASGNVGIGTSSPTEKLTVNGNIKLGTSGTSWIYGPSTTGRSIFSNSDSSAYVIAYGSSYGSSLDAVVQFTAGTSSTSVLNANGSFSLAGATRTANGTGITFPATQSASSDANTLDDYEEGTWTPSDGSGASLSLSTSFSTYTKVGRLVTCSAKIVYPSTASTATTRINGLPFTSSSNNHAVSTMLTDSGTYFSNIVVESASYLLPHNLAGAQLTNVNLTGKLLIFTISYIV